MGNNCERLERYKPLHKFCPADVSERARVTVPCAVRAFADVGDVSLTCLGPAVVTPNGTVPGIPCAVSRFTVSQNMRVNIPFAFRTEVDVGEGHVFYDISCEQEDSVLPLREEESDCCCCEAEERGRYNYMRRC